MKYLKYLIIPITFCFPISILQADDLITVSFENFTATSKTSYQRKLPELITDQLVNSGKFSVVERAKISTVTKELDFQRKSGYVAPESSVATGNLLGAQLLITGAVINSGKSTKRTNVYNTSFTTISYHLKARLEVIDNNTGQKIFSKIASSSNQKKLAGNVSSRGGGIDLGPSVARKLVTAMLNSPSIKSYIDNTGKQAPIPHNQLIINSLPPEADVEIDGDFVGNAGSPFEVRTGVHEIKVSLPGYETWTKRIRVKGDMKFTARLTEAYDRKEKLDLNITK